MLKVIFHILIDSMVNANPIQIHEICDNNGREACDMKWLPSTKSESSPWQNKLTTWFSDHNVGSQANLRRHLIKLKLDFIFLFAWHVPFTSTKKHDNFYDKNQS